MNDATLRTFPHFDTCDAVSKATRASHLALYHGYVKKYAELRERLTALQQRGPQAIADIGSLKGDITYALGAIKNHELYFDSFGPESDAEPQGPLVELLVKSFHSLPQYLVDLRSTAQQGRGWVWTAYDRDDGHLFNYESGASNGLPVWNAVPLLAIDLYGHAYFYDYGNNKGAYIEAIMRCIDWPRMAARLQRARAGLCANCAFPLPGSEIKLALS
jgi:Fe-Mn family superoxide dismutase